MTGRLHLRAVSFWPPSLFGRIAFILFCGLSAAHLLSLGLFLYDRAETVGSMMLAYVAKDVAGSIAILERIPAEERSAWLPVIERANYRYILGQPPGDRVERDLVPAGAAAQRIAATIADALGPRYAVTAAARSRASDQPEFHVGLRLHDGTPLTLAMSLPGTGLSWWVLAALAFQLSTLAIASGIAVRIATRPLARLARAAEELGPDLHGPVLPENGPKEVARAAAAFNAMQHRIAGHIAERLRILAAISHDLRSPITRMRLRTDLLDDGALKQKLQSDLAAMQALIEEGIDLARSAGRTAETAVATDVQALLESFVYDYADSGQRLALSGCVETPLVTRPRALRRIVTNLVDNALKFGEDVEIAVEKGAPDRLSIVVRDRGPGIPEAELDAVFEPFYRVEASRNRDTGGSGLGLTTARRLAIALDGELCLANRPGGGLEARLMLPAAALRSSGDGGAPASPPQKVSIMSSPHDLDRHEQAGV
jgi:signal transduction histidine kinase